MNEPRLKLQNWLETPLGEYMLAWERAAMDAAVADMFGYHALQLGLPALSALQVNRMPHRWLAVPNAALANTTESPPAVQPDLVTDFAALPFFENSLDLLVLPHSLELSSDPHATLREAQRVLVPEGKLVICSFNPMSLWGLKHWRQPNFIPEVGEFIGNRRLKDWLKLLNFEIESSQFACYRPAVRSEKWLQRLAWLDKVGARSWPIFGAVHMVVAVKRVHGMKLLSPNWKMARVPKITPISIANKSTNTPATGKTAVENRRE